MPRLKKKPHFGPQKYFGNQCIWNVAPDVIELDSVNFRKNFNFIEKNIFPLSGHKEVIPIFSTFSFFEINTYIE